jgi:pantoate--beta-alanine ligase
VKIIRTVAGMCAERRALGGRTLGFVPTMGYLHAGHLSLVSASRAANDVTAVSIFVNPTQFAPTEDLAAYPRDPERDSRMLEAAGADLLFFPEAGDIYPPGFATEVAVPALGKKLEGRFRPTHFRGVTTIVLKLLEIVGADRAYFGQKDAQQAVIVTRMAVDLNLSARICVQPIVRDADGLALSSRNVYLSADERSRALAMPVALAEARGLVAAGETDARRLRRLIRRRLRAVPGLTIDYVETVRLDTLDRIDCLEPANTLVACAIRVGRTRLIDNFVLGEIYLNRMEKD